MKRKECPSCAMEVDQNATQCPICAYEFPRTNWVLQGVAILLILVFLYFLIF
jgi:RNA polymerase subunit RPABC4/transcription elongation factor Spt4